MGGGNLCRLPLRRQHRQGKRRFGARHRPVRAVNQTTRRGGARRGRVSNYQKSLVSGVPIANVLFSASAIGPVLLPIMIYYPLQLIVGSLVAKWHRQLVADGIAAGTNGRPILVVAS